MMAAIVILVYDAARGGSLNMTPAQRKRFDACSKRSVTHSALTRTHTHHTHSGTHVVTHSTITTITTHDYKV